MTKKAILMMGISGAGKSTVRDRMFDRATWTVIDCDEVKQTLPGYDPKNPGTVHEESKRIADAIEAAAIADGANLILDGTGTNAEKMAYKTNVLHAAGYEVELIYVAVRLTTALARNAARARTVPEAIVREKASLIATAFEIVARYVDKITVINND